MREFIPVRFEGYMEKGGSTKPWKIIAIEKNKTDPIETPFVLKLFKESHILQQNSIGKEFLANHLASEFDLNVPECGIIKLSSVFVSILDESERTEYEQKYQGYTFASQLLEQAFLVDIQLPKKFNIIDCASIFAFDCLLMNVDRGGMHQKPNLLLNDESFVLIDHELILAFADSQDEIAYDRIIESLNTNTLGKYWYENHLFYPILKKYRGNKKGIFNDFSVSLSSLNINGVKEYIRCCELYGVSFGNKALILAYLVHIKAIADKFTKILYGLIA